MMMRLIARITWAGIDTVQFGSSSMAVIATDIPSTINAIMVLTVDISNTIHVKMKIVSFPINQKESFMLSESVVSIPLIVSHLSSPQSLRRSLSTPPSLSFVTLYALGLINRINPDGY